MTYRNMIRKELLEELLKYKVAVSHKGEIYSLKPRDWSGFVFVVPEDKWKEWME